MNIKEEKQNRMNATAEKIIAMVEKETDYKTEDWEYDYIVFKPKGGSFADANKVKSLIDSKFGSQTRAYVDGVKVEVGLV
jgi:flagellar basal body P-ring protein FlgI